MYDFLSGKTKCYASRFSEINLKEDAKCVVLMTREVPPWDNIEGEPIAFFSLGTNCLTGRLKSLPMEQVKSLRGD